ncbi:MAG TPA: hypothetical protein VNB22_08340 [Pyrinomonadaceae bacterium]|nr:hypothetical protein [Pyrinomonadaceae bacterium]
MNVDETQLQIEVLQPEISGEIQKTTSEELKAWIKDGKLKPNHQLRVKNLPWMEAQKIPAFQTLFESVKYEPENQSNNFDAYPLSKSSAPKLDEPEPDEATAFSKKLSSLAGRISIKTETDDSDLNKNPKNSEPSLAFKLFEEKALARSKKNEAKPELSRIPSGSQKKPSFVKKTAAFLAGCVLLFLLSLGGSYFWVYQLKTPAFLDEKAIPELSGLENKLTSDKLELRLKAEREKELIAADSPEPVRQIDFSKEVLKLENQFNIARKEIIKNRAAKLQNNDFYTTFYFSFAVLLCLFLLLKVFYGRTAEPIAVQNKPELPEVEISDDLYNLEAVDETIEAANYQKTEVTEPYVEHITNSPEENLQKFTGKNKTIDETPVTRENTETVKTQKPRICILHLDKPSNFVCEGCSNHYCADCTVTLEDNENCCPFCRFVCRSLEVEGDETAPQKSETEEKKKPNLLDLYGNAKFTVREFPDERTKKIRVISAFLISLAFSISISIFWVYKISPYLDNRGKETSQNIVNVNGQTAGNLSNKTVESDNNKTKADNTAKEPCIDPQTRKPFECDEETRRALEDYTKKVNSVEKAQSETAEKTDKILGLVNPTSENSKQESLKQNPSDEAQKEFEKQQLIKVFICSFLAIFGSLMLTRIFSKDKDPE